MLNSGFNTSRLSMQVQLNASCDYLGYGPQLLFPYVSCVFSYNIALFSKLFYLSQALKTYITKKEDFRAKVNKKMQMGKCDSFFFYYDAKSTPTVKCHCWLNVIRSKMQ